MDLLAATAGVRRGTILLLAALAYAGEAFGDVVLDGSLGGSTVPLSGPDYIVDASVGRQVGRNLFHSFSTFSLDSGQSATFTANDGGAIDNVLGRVTGGQASHIDGLLRSTIPGADLYLVNPRGVVFGPNANLDLPAAFHVSSADYVGFDDGTRFTALPSAADPLLSVAPPAAFGFLSGDPGPITLDRSTLRVAPGQALSVVAGAATIAGDVPVYPAFADDPPAAAGLQAPGGAITIFSVASPGEVAIVPDGPAARGFGAMGEIRIVDGALVDASGPGGGTVHLRGGDVTLAGSTLQSWTWGDTAGRDVTVGAAALTMMDAAIDTSTFGNGHGGSIEVEVAGAMTLNGDNRPSVESPPYVISNAGLLSRAVGSALESADAGDIRVQAADLFLGGGAVLDTSAIAATSGNSGDIDVRVDNALVVDGENPFAAFIPSVSSSGTGIPVFSSAIVAGSQALDFGQPAVANGGDIRLNAGTVEIRNGGRVSTDTFGFGPGGDITIDASGNVRVTGASASGISSRVTLRTLDQGNADAGDLVIAARDIDMSHGGILLSLTRGNGDGGDIRLNASGDMRMDAAPDGPPANISANADGLRGLHTGRAGAIAVSARSLDMVGGSRIETATQTDGDAGGIHIDVVGDLRISGQWPAGSAPLPSALSTESNGPGDAGDIRIAARRAFIDDGAEVLSTSSLSGNTGDIEMTLVESLQIDNASILASAASSDGGNISINASDLVALHRAQITTSVGTGRGDGGNITIDPRFVVVNRSQIVANAFGGDGGSIRITAGRFIASPDSLLQASSALQTDGEVVIASPDEALGLDLEPLRVPFSDAAPVLDRRCADRSGGDVIGLYVKRIDAHGRSPYGLAGPGPLPDGPAATPATSTAFAARPGRPDCG